MKKQDPKKKAAAAGAGYRKRSKKDTGPNALPKSTMMDVKEYKSMSKSEKKKPFKYEGERTDKNNQVWSKTGPFHYGYGKDSGVTKEMKRIPVKKL